MGTIAKLTVILSAFILIHSQSAFSGEAAKTKRQPSRGLASIGQLRPASMDDMDRMIASPHEPRLMQQQSADNTRFHLMGTCRDATGQTYLSGGTNYENCMTQTPFMNSSAENYFNSAQRQVGAAVQLYP